MAKSRIALGRRVFGVQECGIETASQMEQRPPQATLQATQTDLRTADRHAHQQRMSTYRWNYVVVLTFRLRGDGFA